MPDDLPGLSLCPAGCAPGWTELHPGPALPRALGDCPVPDDAAEMANDLAGRHMRPRASPLAAEDDRAEFVQRPPEILLRSTLEWRIACLAQAAHVPAGYTYLAQLMGHDMGSSISADAVPYAGTRAPRYNLIDNPLTLETVYGPGPSLLAHVYDPETLLFRLTPGARLARIYARGRDTISDVDPRPIRALYDERNRDTLMLHELTVAWMQFHNRNARALLAGGASAFEAYCHARAHAVRVWHGILLGDVLPRFVHPEINALPPDRLPASWMLDETTLLHGLCRAFHALPLAAYHLGRSGQHNLNTLLKRSYDISEAEADWFIDWPQFLGGQPGGPMTGMSASVAAELRAPVTAMAVIELDRKAAIAAKPLRAGNADIRQAIADLPAAWRDRIAPAQLAADFAESYPMAPIHMDAATLEWGPLFQFLMVEAQIHGRDGGFGPLGSALLRASVQGSASRVLLAPETGQTRALPRPQTMLDLITLVRME